MNHHLIHIRGIIAISRLEDDLQLIEDEEFLCLMLADDPDRIIGDLHHARAKYFRTHIRTDNPTLIPGIVYFPSTPTSSSIIQVRQQEIPLTLLDITGFISFVEEGNYDIRFVITIASYRTVDMLNLYRAGSLDVTLEILYRRIQDIDLLLPPIFEFFFRNQSIYTELTYTIAR